MNSVDKPKMIFVCVVFSLIFWAVFFLIAIFFTKNIYFVKYGAPLLSVASAVLFYYFTVYNAKSFSATTTEKFTSSYFLKLLFVSFFITYLVVSYYVFAVVSGSIGTFMFVGAGVVVVVLKSRDRHRGQ